VHPKVHVVEVWGAGLARGTNLFVHELSDEIGKHRRGAAGRAVIRRVLAEAHPCKNVAGSIARLVSETVPTAPRDKDASRDIGVSSSLSPTGAWILPIRMQNCGVCSNRRFGCDPCQSINRALPTIRSKSPTILMSRIGRGAASSALGAAVLAGSAVALTVLGYLAIYILVFLPRGVVG
jgi:hypothetical protein